ncbi:MAG: hypothetical protein KKA42_02625, partial [candidate division Zixibacteria bacterium]|nr:hypothetical protein [candidate division Zixibacteria bacterium]
MSDKTHPGRSELLAALTAEAPEVTGHLASCEVCRAEFEVMRLVFPTGTIPTVESPGETHLAKLVTIPARRAGTRDRSTVPGKVAYDSWTGMTGVQMRDAARGTERRLRLSAGSVELELVAGRQLAGWEFSARGYI